MIVRLLSDGAWHSLSEIWSRTSPYIPPEAALRRLRRHPTRMRGDLIDLRRGQIEFIGDYLRSLKAGGLEGAGPTTNRRYRIPPGSRLLDEERAVACPRCGRFQTLYDQHLWASVADVAYCSAECRDAQAGEL